MHCKGKPVQDTIGRLSLGGLVLCCFGISLLPINLEVWCGICLSKDLINFIRNVKV